MSYEEFRRRIDTARQILVGAVPSPAGQIDQITYALIYKFMNDIDDKSASLGGKRSYFTGDYEKYNWNNLMAPSLGAHERLELYRQAIQTMARNPGLPSMFAEIYQNAFLPFNDERVLTLFLKEMDKFRHGESDDIGDAYEYLLSITGAQGDVGQFRTPRHIIEFVVSAVNPSKDDSVLDPACGTAGFLIKAYEHVMSQHDGKDTHGNTNDEKRLTASELEKIHHNYHGFDIDPTMVRTAKVNMYLHGFTSPDIINHDSLSDEKYWEKRYDVILANPPFMTPKGGIQPHKKFSVSANRAEVLFVDYIMSHLNPVSGRAGIIVPEGIIFQSGKAYQQLRKNLVENSLYAVVSLPSGVFNPYAGVKTSILLLDKQLAKERDDILFVKIENDGYSLGAQRRPIAGNQFPEALEAIEQFRTGAEPTSQLAHAVKKSKIAESGDYNLSGDRYIQSSNDLMSKYELVDLGELVDIDNGNAFKSSEYADDGARVIRITNVQKGKIVDDSPKFMAIDRMAEFVKYELYPNDILMSLTGNVGRVGMIEQSQLPALLNQRVARLRANETKVLREYVFHILNSDNFENAAINSASGIAQKNLSTEWLKTYKIPLPPLEIQRQIVDELDGYQRIIDAATAIVKTYKPTIKINPAWERVRVDSVLDELFAGGDAPKGHMSDTETEAYTIPIYSNGLEDKALYGYTDRARVNKDSVTISARGTIGTPVVRRAPFFPIVRLIVATPNTSRVLVNYLRYALEKEVITSTGNSIQQLTVPMVKQLSVSLPSIEVQKQIVADLEAEQKLIDANKKLITLYQQKIRTKIAEVWGE